MKLGTACLGLSANSVLMDALFLQEARDLGARGRDLGAHGRDLSTHGRDLGAHGRDLSRHGRDPGAHRHHPGAHGRDLNENRIKLKPELKTGLKPK